MLSNMSILVAYDMSSSDVCFAILKALGSLCIIFHFPYRGERLIEGDKFVKNKL